MNEDHDRERSGGGEIPPLPLMPPVPRPPPMPEFPTIPAHLKNREPKPTIVGTMGRDSFRLMGVALNFVGLVGGGVLLGWLLDRWQGWSPWGVLLGMTVGLVGGGYRLLKETGALNPIEPTRRPMRGPDRPADGKPDA